MSRIIPSLVVCCRHCRRRRFHHGLRPLSGDASGRGSVQLYVCSYDLCQPGIGAGWRRYDVIPVPMRVTNFTDFGLRVSRCTKLGSVSLSVQPEGKGRREPPEIAWGSDIFSRGGRDVKPCCRTRMDYHTPSGSYGMSRTSLCTESETDPNKLYPDSSLPPHRGQPCIGPG